MAVKIHETLCYIDPVSGKPDRGYFDHDRGRESVVRQSNGEQPHAYGWKEIAAALGIEEKSAHHRIRDLALSLKVPSTVNSCYHIQWHNITSDYLYPDGTAFETIRKIHGLKPALIERPDIGNRKWDVGNLARQIGWGRDGGAGNKKIADTVIPD